ncbi:MAG: hypothetical protein J3Q66DRAFT_383294 [Benniella sp.]|nr:MAG: hypothetical protein J3Q66DRAFT_383294 [Benniella sp.]
MATSNPYLPTPSPAHRQTTMHDEDEDPRLSSTSVVATLRHSPRLLLRKKASALKEPAQSPDIFARDQTDDSHLSRYTSSGNRASGIVTTTSTTTTTTTTATTTTAMTIASHMGQSSTDMVLDNHVQTRSSRSSSSATATTITMAELSSLPTPKTLGVVGQCRTSMVSEESSRLVTMGTDRRSRISTRSLSQTRETTRTRSNRPRARSRTIPTKVKVPGDDEEKSDADDDDEEEEGRFRYHLRSPAYHRRLRSIQKSPASDTTMETPAISGLTLTPRLTRLGARHESGHDFEYEPETEQPHPPNRRPEKTEKSLSLHGRRSRSTTSSSSQDSPAVKGMTTEATYSSPGAQAAPRKTTKKSSNHHHTVPSLPSGRRRLSARTTKTAKMGIDSEGGIGDEDDEEDDEEEDEDEDEDEDVDSDYRKKDRNETMMEVESPSSGLSRQAGIEDTNALNSCGTLNGFIASKPEASLVTAGGVPSTFGIQAVHHAKRKVEDEDMEDVPAISTDEGQLVSTKLARIDDTSDGDKQPYLNTFDILKTPRGDDDDGILSSESDDADLESEDDDDDFEEIDVWEFIATLPPLGPLPQNFIFTMPEKTSTTPPITLVLDIDETLVHCATRPLDSPDIVFPVEYNHETWKVYGRIRPGMQEFLEKMSTMFEVITFTASQECYAEALLKIIDPEKKYIRHRYYRDSCVPVFGNYVKDLRILNRDLSKVIIIDNSPQAFGYQISNGIPIESWYDDKSDRELYKVMTFLETVERVEDVRPRIDEHYKLQEKIQKALAQAAAQQQLSSMNGLGALGTNALAGLQNLIPGSDDMDATMAMYDDLVKPQSDEDDEREDDEEKNLRGRRRKGGAAGGTRAGAHGTTMTTRSTGLDAANLAQISL